MAAPPSYDKTSEELSTDYLAALRKHAELVIRNKLPASALISTPIEYVITVPAVWSDTAQSKTRECAERAGMGQGSALQIISEPEAAAMYALDLMDPHNIKVGDTFNLCDAGGGTVDLISYRVNSLKPTLSVEEASPGNGMLCGSTFLNRIFQKYIEDRLSALPGWDDDILEEAVKRFDVVVKRQFRGVPGEEFMIPVPGLRDNAFRGVRRGRLTMTGEQVREIFEPVIKEILGLIDDQIKATKVIADVKAVLLVGGFGQNAYLRDRIRAAIGGIEVMQSPNGWTAVVRGALMKGLASSSPSFATVGLSSRCARKSYGIFNVSRECKPGDEESLKVWESYLGKFRTNCMLWFLKKGDEVKENSPFQLRYSHVSLASSPNDQKPRIKIVYFSDSNSTCPPEDPKNPNIKHLVDVTADLSRIPIDRIQETMGADLESYRGIDYEIEITYYSAFTKYELVHQGINYGAVTAEYA